MDIVFGVDWHKLFVPSTPVLETVLRGTLMYLALFVLMRSVLQRETGSVRLTDLLVIVLLADAAQNALADDYASIPDGILLVATILFWSRALNWLTFRFRPLERLLHPAPLPLARDGRLLRRNMARELVTEEELMSQLRLQGVDDLAEVKAVHMEGDGRFSVVLRDGAHPVAARERSMA
jgi:uncharacterized membrane protein YcaP (DUF421 family)